MARWRYPVSCPYLPRAAVLRNLYNRYISAVFDTIDHSILAAEKHLPSVKVKVFADNTQLYLSFYPMSSVSQDQASQAIEECIVDVRAWMRHNMLKLNDSKTEFLIIGSRQQLVKVNVDSVQVGSSKILSTSSVRNLDRGVVW